ncbi:MAG TPA: hypothetical protein VM533_05515 [Fimbriiglobus sp.]|jgi:hypothetical protein|nr:hypothetical protein [Fimbriiglobus sp.]
MTPKKKLKLSEVVKDMADLRTKWAGTAPAPDTDKPIPAGTYVCDLTEGTAFESRTGTPGYKVTLRVRGGDYTGRLIWHDYYLSEKALPYTMRALARIGVTDLAQLDEGLRPGLVVKARVVVRTRDDGGECNEVRSWELVEVADEAAPTPSNPPTQPSPAPDAPAPWAVDLDTLDGETPEGGAR